MKQNNIKLKKQMLSMQLRAGVINESVYAIRLQKVLKEEEEILGKTGVTGLSAVDKDLAKAAVYNSAGKKDGSSDDDAAGGGKVPIAVKDLRASQTEIKRDKATSMAISLVLNNKYNGADLGAIVSGDKPAYIMDGHHRWAATFLIDPNATLKVTQIMLPGQALVSALNIITVGGLGKTTGNSGKGSVQDFTGKNIGALIDEYMTKGTPGDPANKVDPISPENVKKALGLVPGADGNPDQGKQIMMKNADALPKEIMPGAPPRVEMPVIDPKVVGSVAALLKKGAIDIKPPYSTPVKKAMNKTQEKGDNANQNIQEAVHKKLEKILTESVKKSSI